MPATSTAVRVSLRSGLSTGGGRHGFGADPPQNVLSPTVNQTGQELDGKLRGNFLILIVSSVKICKQCLQTASALGPLSGPWTPMGISVPQTSWATVPQMKITGAATWTDTKPPQPWRV